MLSLPKTYILFLFLICNSIVTKSQSLLYPVKQNHKWGYMDIRGKIVIEPRYDIISNQNLSYYSHRGKRISKYRLVETNEKLGLIDNKKAEIISPAYNRIRVLTDSIFAVILNEDEDQFMVIDAQGNKYFEKKYREISHLGHNRINGQDYFLVRNGDEFWGVQKSKDSLILPIKYRNIELCQVNGDFFKVKQHPEYSIWGIFKAGNKEVLPIKYDEITACHENLFAAKQKDKLWAAYDSTGAEILKAEYNYFTPLNRHLMSMQRHDSKTKRNRTYLYSFITNDTIADRSQYTYLPLDEKFVDFGQATFERGLLDTLGNIVLQPRYFFIRNYDDELYKLNLGGKWGLWHPDNRMVVECLYDSIGDFSNQFVEVFSEVGVGLMNKNFVEIIPPYYTRIKIEGKTVKAFKGKNVEIFKLNDEGEVIGMEDYKDVFSFKLKSKGGEVLDAREVKRKWKIVNQLGRIKSDPENYTKDFLNSSWRWRVDVLTKDKPVILADTTIEVNKNHPNFKKIKSLRIKRVVHIGESGMTFLYSKRDKHKSYFSILTGLSVICKAAIFDHAQQDLSTPFSILGVRKYDFQAGHKYAATIDENLAFNFIDQKGNFLKGADGEKMNFTYIGNFFNGKARVCKGGKLIEMESTDFLKYAPTTIANLCKQFNIVGYYKNKPKEGYVRISSTEENPAQWGFIDSLGNFVVTPQYKYLEDDIDGQAVAVNQEGKWGVINSKNNQKVIDFKYAKISHYFGDWRINAKAGQEIYFNKRGWQIVGSEYESKGDFKNGFCKVQKNGKWGFIEENGDLAIECKYDVVKDFHHNNAATKTGDQWTFIDKTGNEVLTVNQPNIEEIGNIVNGRCWFKSGGLYGYLDSLGNVLLAPKYKRAFNFEKNVARVIQNKKTGIIDLEGKEILAPNTFTFIYPFDNNGLAIIQKEQTGVQGLINEKGEIILKPTYHSIDKFRDGLAAVSNGKDFGYIDTKGKLVIPLKFKEAKPFSEGLAPVRQTSQEIWVYINKQGKKSVKGTFLKTSPFIEGRAQVKKYTYGKIDGVGMIIDRKGKIINKDLNQLVFYEDNIAGVFNKNNPNGNPNNRYYYGDIRLTNLFDSYFQEVNPFSNGFSVFRKSRKLGVLNKRGMKVVKNKYYSLDVVGENIISVRPPSFGIADRTGRVTIPIQFDEITLMSGDIYKIEQGEKVGYADKNGKWIWELQF